MSRRRHDAGYHHRRLSPEERELQRYVAETASTAPMMPYPLPGERENSWTIYEVLAEIARLKPSYDEAKRLHYEQRRAAMPHPLKDLLAKKVGEAKAEAEADAQKRSLRQADAEKLASLTDRAAERAARAVARVERSRQADASRAAKRAARAALRALIEHERLLSVSERAAARAARKALRDAQRSAERDARRAEEGPRARNGKASIAHLTPEQKRERKLEQTRMSNRRKRAERKAALSAANVTFVQQSLA